MWLKNITPFTLQVMKSYKRRVFFLQRLSIGLLFQGFNFIGTQETQAVSCLVGDSELTPLEHGANFSAAVTLSPQENFLQFFSMAL